MAKRKVKKEYWQICLEYAVTHPKTMILLLGGLVASVCVLLLVSAVVIQGESLELLDRTLDVIDDEVRK